MAFGNSSPRPTRPENKLGRLLLSLEEDPQHATPIDVWGRLLAGYDPAGYADREASGPAQVEGRERIIRLYRKRAAAGQRLTHPNDKLALLAGEYWRAQEALRQEQAEQEDQQ